MPTRFYLPSTGSAAVSPAFGSQWNTTTSATRHPLPMSTKSNTGLNSGTARAKVSQAGAQNRLDRQFVSGPLAAGTISGTFSAVMKWSESASTADAWMQIVIRVVSFDGATERGVLYAGSTASGVVATSGAENEELAPSVMATRIKNAIALTSVVAQAKDRLVVETGFRAVTANTNTATAQYGDATANSDYALTAGTTSTGTSWVELSATLAVYTPPAVDTLVDAFNSQDTAIWTSFDTGVSAAGGELLMESSSSRQLVSVGRYNVTDKAIYMDVLDPAHSTVQLVLLDITPNTALYFRVVDGVLGGVAVNAAGSAAGTPTSTWNPVSQRYLRIRHTPSEIFFDTSPDATNWTTWNSVAGAYAMPEASVNIFSSGSTPTVNVRLGGINPGPDPFVPPRPTVMTQAAIVRAHYW